MTASNYLSSPPAAGDVVWLPKPDRTNTIDAGVLNHPVLVLYVLPNGQCWFLMMTSFGGKPINRRFHGPSERQTKSRKKYIPVAPTAPHPDTGMRLVPVVTGNPVTGTKGGNSYIKAVEPMCAHYQVLGNLWGGTMKLEEAELKYVRGLVKSFATPKVRTKLTDAEKVESALNSGIATTNVRSVPPGSTPSGRQLMTATAGTRSGVPSTTSERVTRTRTTNTGSVPLPVVPSQNTKAAAMATIRVVPPSTPPEQITRTRTTSTSSIPPYTLPEQVTRIPTTNIRRVLVPVASERYTQTATPSFKPIPSSTQSEWNSSTAATHVISPPPAYVQPERSPRTQTGVPYVTYIPPFAPSDGGRARARTAKPKPRKDSSSSSSVLGIFRWVLGLVTLPAKCVSALYKKLCGANA